MFIRKSFYQSKLALFLINRKREKNK